jgi:hypothetical protein
VIRSPALADAPIADRRPMARAGRVRARSETGARRHDQNPPLVIVVESDRQHLL